MLRRIADNKLINAASFYLLSTLLFVMLPFLFIFKIMYSIFRHRRMEDCMRGKVVLITGASSAIGEHMAYEYARREAFLAIVARREDRLLKVADKARNLGSPDVIVICADVSNFDDCRRFVDQTVSHFGRLDHLVNNAGISNFYSANEGVEVTKFAPIMDINFWGSVYPAYFAIPHLKKTKGKIVVNASVAAYVPLHIQAFYNASKSALVTFYESLRQDLAPEITITMVTLGAVESEITLGKIVDLKGVMQDNHEMPKAASITMMSTRPCADSIVNAACRGDRYVTEPQVWRVFSLAYFLFPEFVEKVFLFIVGKEPLRNVKMTEYALLNTNIKQY